MLHRWGRLATSVLAATLLATPVVGSRAAHAADQPVSVSSASLEPQSEWVPRLTVRILAPSGFGNTGGTFGWGCYTRGMPRYPDPGWEAGYQYVTAKLDDSTRVSGNDQDGVYSTTVPVWQQSAAGVDCNPAAAFLTDDNGVQRVWQTADLQTDGIYLPFSLPYAPVAGSPLSVSFTGAVQFSMSGAISGGDTQILQDRFGLVSVIASGTLADQETGRTATTSLRANRIWILPVYSGSISVQESMGPFVNRTPIFLGKVSMSGTDVIGASSWFTSGFPWRLYYVSWRLGV